MLKKLSKALALVLVLALVGSSILVFATSGGNSGAPAGDSSFMTSAVPSDVGIRNNYGGYSGVKFTAASDIAVTALGRPDVIADFPMAQDHDVVIWDVETNEIIAKVTVTPDSPIENGYRYENLEQPVELIAGQEYSLVSAEEAGGDYWPVSHDMTGRHTAVATQLKAVTNSNGVLDNDNQPDWCPEGDNNPDFESKGYVGLNFWYTEADSDVVKGSGSMMNAPVPSDVGIRNNRGGYNGIRFTAASDITVTTLGRSDVIADYPMAENHRVVIWDVESNKIIARVTVKPTSPIENGYRYENLRQPVTLLEGKEYSIVSAERENGDYWPSQHDMTGRHTAVVTGLKSITSGSGMLDNKNQPDWMPEGDNPDAWESKGYIGLNFWYTEEGTEDTTTTEDETTTTEDTTTTDGDTTTTDGETTTTTGDTTTTTTDNETDEDVVKGAGSLMKAPVPSDVGVRNNRGGYNGIRFKAAADIVVTTLGRSDIIAAFPMAENHDVVIWDVEKNQIIAKVTVTPDSPIENGYRYENLARKVTLLEGKEYSIVSSERDGGDYWPGHHDMTGRHTAVASGLQAITSHEGILDNDHQPEWIPEGDNPAEWESKGYVGLNFWYVIEEEETTAPSDTDNKPVVMGSGSMMNSPVPSDVGIRNNYEGYSGIRFKATADIVVTTLGRADVIKDYPMKENHDVVIWDVEKNKIIAKVTVTPSSPIKDGYRYENLSKAVTLLKGKEYSIVSAERNGGDYWADSHDMTGRHTNLITGLKAITGSGFLDNENQPDWMPEDNNNPAYKSQGFVGLNFWYLTEKDENPDTGAGSLGYIFALMGVSAASLVILKRKQSRKNG